jgi:single-strand DNA-binding protein
MERSINRIELKGNVGQDPKINVVGENTVAKFNVATHEVYSDKSGALRKETTWHNIVAWAGKGMPDFNEIKKGVCVSLTGRIRTNKYTNNDGEDKQYNEIIANRITIERENH